jgi:hypothetical protein
MLAAVGLRDGRGAGVQRGDALPKDQTAYFMAYGAMVFPFLLT